MRTVNIASKVVCTCDESIAADGEYPIGVVDNRKREESTPAGRDRLAAVALTVAGAFAAAAAAAAVAAVFAAFIFTRAYPAIATVCDKIGMQMKRIKRLKAIVSRSDDAFFKSNLASNRPYAKDDNPTHKTLPSEP